MTTARHYAQGRDLLVDLIRTGRIPGIGQDDLVSAALEQMVTGEPGRLRMPVIYCADCGDQLVFDWYAGNPVTALRLLCLHCARTAQAAGDEVHALVGER
jgi:hypothetical protein